jgi:TetR/AcrR family transcriptional regulator, transcriptional repressor for nem operon
MHSPPGRPLEFDPDAALDAAMQLFWRRGYENTSMQDLLEAMQLSKSSLYQAFGGKQALFERCMSRYGDYMIGELRDALEAAPSGMDFIRHFLESVLDEARGTCEARGCLVLNTANEFARRDPRITAAVAEGLGRFHGVMLATVQRAQREGDIGPGRDAVMLANYLVSSMSGLKTLSKAGADEASLHGIIQLVLETLTKA